MGEMTGPLPGRSAFGVGGSETRRGSLNAILGLRLHRLVSDLQHQTPSSPEADLSFPPKKSPVLTFYYVLTLVFPDEILSSDCLFARRKSGQSAKLAGGS